MSTRFWVKTYTGPATVAHRNWGGYRRRRLRFEPLPITMPTMIRAPHAVTIWRYPNNTKIPMRKYNRDRFPGRVLDVQYRLKE